MKQSYTLVIPFYNERGSISSFLEYVGDYLSGEPINQVVLSNDASTDLSPDRRQECLNIDAKIQIIDLPKHQGQTRALLAGIKAAKTEGVITMDGNGRQSLEYIPELIKKFEQEDLDMGLCVRINKNEATDSHMVFISSLANRIINMLFKVHFRDISCTYKIFKKNIIENIPDEYIWPGMHRYFPLVAIFQGKKVKEILDIKVSKRKHGRSKYSVWKYLETFRDISNLFRLRKYYSKITH